MRIPFRPWLVRAAILLVSALLAVPAAGFGRVAAQSEEAGTAADEVRARHLLRRADIESAKRRSPVTVAPGAGLALPFGPPAVSLPAPDPAALARRPLLKLGTGDLVTSAGDDANALRIVLRPKAARVKRESLVEPFVSRGVDHDAASGRIAIAAVSRVLIYDVETQELVVLTENADGDPFNFVNDVFFDEDGMLLFVDQGPEPTGRLPRDGRVWEYDPTTGEQRRLAGRKKLSNPAFLAADSQGRILVVDLEGGRLVSPLLDARWDRVMLLKGAKRKGGRVVYRKEGIQATAFDVGPDDRMWFGSFSEILLVDGKELQVPCSILELPFEFVTGLVVAEESLAFVADGAASVTGKRFIHEVDDACESAIRAKGKRLNGVRGLAMVREAETESGS